MGKYLGQEVRLKTGCEHGGIGLSPQPVEERKKPWNPPETLQKRGPRRAALLLSSLAKVGKLMRWEMLLGLDVHSRLRMRFPDGMI